MRKQWKWWETFIYLGSKITADGDCSHEIKRRLLLGRSYEKPRQDIKKQRHYFVEKVLSSQSYGFLAVMYGCESWIIKKADYQRIDGIELWCWRRLLRVPWGARISNQSNLKFQSWIFIGRTDAAAETSILWPFDVKNRLREKTLMLGKIEGRRRGRQRMKWLNDITNSMDMNLSNSRSWWWTGKSGMLQSMGLQRMVYNWETEVNWTEIQN